MHKNIQLNLKKRFYNILGQFSFDNKKRNIPLNENPPGHKWLRCYVQFYLHVKDSKSGLGVKVFNKPGHEELKQNCPLVCAVIYSSPLISYSIIL